MDLREVKIVTTVGLFESTRRIELQKRQKIPVNESMVDVSLKVTFYHLFISRVFKKNSKAALVNLKQGSVCLCIS